MINRIILWSVVILATIYFRVKFSFFPPEEEEKDE